MRKPAHLNGCWRSRLRRVFALATVLLHFTGTFRSWNASADDFLHATMTADCCNQEIAARIPGLPVRTRQQLRSLASSKVIRHKLAPRGVAMKASELFVISALILLVMALVARFSSHSGLGVAITWRGTGYVVPPSTICIALATVLCFFATVYSLWMLPFNRTATLFHFWLTAVGIGVLIKHRTSHTTEEMATIFIGSTQTFMRQILQRCNECKGDVTAVECFPYLPITTPMTAPESPPVFLGVKMPDDKTLDKGHKARERPSVFFSKGSRINQPLRGQ